MPAMLLKRLPEIDCSGKRKCLDTIIPLRASRFVIPFIAKGIEMQFYSLIKGLRKNVIGI